jgi:hypothetical protein
MHPTKLIQTVSPFQYASTAIWNSFSVHFIWELKEKRTFSAGFELLAVMRLIVSCDGPVQFKQLVVVHIRQLVGFVRKICFLHYSRIAICKQVHPIIAKTTHFTSVTFRIVVLLGCRRKLISDVRKNNVHTPLLSRTFRNSAMVSGMSASLF